jgi:hypothetical protein
LCEPNSLPASKLCKSRVFPWTCRPHPIGVTAVLPKHGRGDVKVCILNNAAMAIGIDHATDTLGRMDEFTSTRDALMGTGHTSGWPTGARRRKMG